MNKIIIFVCAGHLILTMPIGGVKLPSTVVSRTKSDWPTVWFGKGLSTLDF